MKMKGSLLSLPNDRRQRYGSRELKLVPFDDEADAVSGMLLLLAVCHTNCI